MPRKKTTSTVKPLKKIKTPSLLRGFKDNLPHEQKYWWAVSDKARELATRYSYERIRLPILEDLKLFTHGVGIDTDIVSKEMFSFKDRDDKDVALRPEMTAPAVRSYINHGMLNMPQPVKMYYFGPNFRYERPQSGRLRQFFQFGCEAIGEDHPVLDAQMIIIPYNLCTELGLEVKVLINSIGTRETRSEYRKTLIAFYRTQKSDLCDNCKERLTRNPLRLLDCKEEKCRIIREDAPQIVDWLDDESKKHFMNVLEFLDEAGIEYELDPFMVRGLDYYTKTVFEVVLTDDNSRAQSALAAGGRYDDLVETLGGREKTPAVGFAAGVERIILKLKEKEIEVPEVQTADVLVAQLGENAKRKAFSLFEEMRKEGISVMESFAKDGLKPQLEAANKANVQFTLILGTKELSEGTIIIRDMDGGGQESVSFDKVIKEVKKRIK